MKEQRGKKAKYLVPAKKGLVNDNVWRRILDNYPTDIVCSIREQLLRKVPGLTEKFNTNSRYFGYWTATDETDRAYIYVQKRGFRIDLCVKRRVEPELRRAGFEVRYVNNFQARAGWLTGWRVPHTTKDTRAIMKWLLRAFEEDT
jgi:hypothetical protein